MKIITAFKCDYCGKIYQVKGFTTRHEKFCFQNPENQVECLACGNLDVDRNDLGATVFYCIAKDIFMHTHIAKRRNLPIVKTTEPMPLECDSFIVMNKEKVPF